VHRVSILIVTPALADANNGNWQTARRWAAMLGTAYRVRLAARWEPADGDEPALMIALHARRSAASIAAWRAALPQRPLLLVLTGTDLYRDIDIDAEAQRSLALADRLVVLNALGAQRLPPGFRDKCKVVLQSCTARRTLPKSSRYLRALMVGHLREEKDPRTFFLAVQRLADRSDLRFDHIGAALDPALGDQATTLAAADSRYRWFGPRPHGETRRRIQSAHLLVHASRMEGGAHAVIEAVRSGTPVIASLIDGNVGLLGEDYGGYFAPGDDAALADLLQRSRDDPAMLPALQRQIAARASLFAPEAEAATLQRLVADLIHCHADGARA
jgi:putative glycosyltransferase (TIGR04348 family)